MSATASYMVCVVLESGAGIGPHEGAISLRHAQQVIDRLRTCWPDAHMIFLRRYKRGTDSFVVLHKYTVHNGTTAEQRRAEACR